MKSVANSYGTKTKTEGQERDKVWECWIGERKKAWRRQETVLIQRSERLQNGYLGIVLAGKPHKGSD